jgi:hypothetical protein
MMRNNPHLMTLKEGRELLRTASPFVRGTVWETALNPLPRDPELDLVKKELEEAWDKIQEMRPVSDWALEELGDQSTQTRSVYARKSRRF